MEYRLYGLRPDRRFIGTADSLDEARERTRAAVNSGYEHAEVWADGRPVFAAWKEGRIIRDTERKGGRQ